MSLTEQGFDRPRLNEIKADYDQRFTDALGPINTSPDAVAGQIIGILFRCTGRRMGSTPEHL